LPNLHQASPQNLIPQPQQQLQISPQIGQQSSSQSIPRSRNSQELSRSGEEHLQELQQLQQKLQHQLQQELSLSGVSLEEDEVPLSTSKPDHIIYDSDIEDITSGDDYLNRFLCYLHMQRVPIFYSLGNG